MRTRRVQIIVESHSEYFVRRLQRRVAEEQLAAPDVALYFRDTEDGSSRLDAVQVDIFGEIVNWLDFFGDELGTFLQ